MAIAGTKVCLQQTLQTHKANSSVSLSHYSVLPLRLIMDIERGPRYDAYAELREKKLRMKYLRRQQQEEVERLDLEPKLPTPPRKQVKFQGGFSASGVRKKTGSSVLAQSVPDFSAVLRKENRKPSNVLPSVMELTPPPSMSKSVSKGGILSSSSRGSKSANAGEKQRNSRVLMARKSYATIDELKNFSSATANAINGEARGGRSSRVVGRNVLGYRQF